MKPIVVTFLSLLTLPLLAAAAELAPAFPLDPLQSLERTCFQTGQATSPNGNLRSDVAIVYGIDPGLPQRIQTWRDRGYRIHVMTGVSWGHYQDYLYGRFDGTNHEDEAQTDRRGKKISHGGDVYYMSPGTNYGKFLSVGVQRALDAGAEAIHLEEPEFWVRAGYSEGFKREWREYYQEAWQPPHESVEAQWRASKLKYYLYGRALQQVFDHVQAYNQQNGKNVRCYVPTHSLLNYAHWRIVSPESSLARLKGCDGYIAQVWTGTSRTPNVYRGQLRERTFETAFLEYGAMQNLVRSTGRTVWYLNDPIEDDPKHDWEDYRVNWESTLVASLFQPEVWRYEVAPWPERVFGGRYPAGSPNPQSIPPAYATELQTVMHTLNDLKQDEVEWDCGTPGIGILVSDSLMFQRGEPTPSDSHMSQLYGIALPLLKRGMPITPVQLENATVPGYLNSFKALFLTYTGMKPLSPDVHPPIVEWIQAGGHLVVVDDDQDPYHRVREWWNTGPMNYGSPREHLFSLLPLSLEARNLLQSGEPQKVGAGSVVWIRKNPATLAASSEGDAFLTQSLHDVFQRAALKWRVTNYLLLRRGPYLIGAGLDESSDTTPRTIQGRFVSLFDPELRVRQSVELTPRGRFFLLDLDRKQSGRASVLAAACKTLPLANSNGTTWTVEGVARTPAVVLFDLPHKPQSVRLDGQPLDQWVYSEADHLLWVRFENESRPRHLTLEGL